MRKVRIILTSTALLVIILFSCSYLWFLLGRGNGVHENPDYSLFMAEKVFKDYNIHDYGDLAEHHKTMPSEVWRMDESLITPEVRWILPKDGFEKLDTLTMGIENETKTKFYYMSWGEPNSRMRKDLIIHRSDQSDTIGFGGFGCETGIYLQAIEAGEQAIGEVMNPLVYDPYSGYELPLNSDTLPELIKTLYGDSVSIRHRLATYSLPWSQYESKEISSPWVTVSTDKIILNWEKGNYAQNQRLDEYTLDYYGMKK